MHDSASNSASVLRAEEQVSQLPSYGRLDVTIAHSVYKAGELSTVAIVIRNPFDKEVEILDIQGTRSFLLRDTNDVFKNADEVNRQTNILNRVLKSVGQIKIVSGFSFAGISAELTSLQESNINIDAQGDSDVTINPDMLDHNHVNIKAKDKAKITFQPSPLKPSVQTRKSVVVQPHCETVAYFQLITSGWLFFLPTKQTLSAQIRYIIENVERTQVISSDFEIKPPLISIVIGAITGYFLGAVAKLLTRSQELGWHPPPSILASVVKGLIASVALARKSAAQAFITVEDFYGWFVVGALVGYGGTQYFEQTLIPKSTNPPSG